MAFPRSLGAPASSAAEPFLRFQRRYLRHNIHASLKDGAGFSVMVGLGETYLPAFVLALGLGEVNAGLIAAVPLVAGAFFQLVSPFMVQWLGSYRRWVVICATLQCAGFLPLMAAALVGYLPPALAFLIASVYWGMGMGAGPAWNGWMGRLIAPAVRTEFFAKRTRITQMGSLVGFIGGGLFLHAVPAPHKVPAFALLFFVAFIGRVLSVRALASQTEDPESLADFKPPSPSTILRPLADRPAGHLFLYVFLLQFGTYLSAPFFTPYMLEHLSVGYLGYVVLVAASYVAKIVSLPYMASYAKAHGTRALMWLSGIGVVSLPALWLVSSSFTYLLAVQFMAGFFWSAFDLAFPLLVLETVDEKDRLNVLTLHNFCQSMVIVLAALIGAAFLDGLGRGPLAYSVVFVLSTLLRGVALLRLRNLSPPAFPKTVSWRTIGIRPSIGALVVPVLGTVKGRRLKPRIRRSAPKRAAPP